MTNIKMQKTGEIKKLVNLTAEAVVLLNEYFTPLIELPPAEEPAKGHRGRTELGVVELMGTMSSITVVAEFRGAALGIPEPAQGTYYIVDDDTYACALQERWTQTDLFTLGDPVHEGGVLIGWRKLILNTPTLPQAPSWRNYRRQLIGMQSLKDKIGEEELRNRLYPQDFLHVEF